MYAANYTNSGVKLGASGGYEGPFGTRKMFILDKI